MPKRISTGIAGRIHRLIQADLLEVIRNHSPTTIKETKELIRRYRDNNFLNGNFDYLFNELIKNAKQLKPKK